MDLVSTPEVMRLSQVRLLNSPSPSQAALGEIRRFSHTLGVLALANQCRSRAFGEHEWRAFEASVLLHDVGTNPFGHLVEYHLRERNGNWDHEAMILDILNRTHAPENRAHQIFMGRTVRVPTALQRNGIDVGIVRDIIGRAHPLSPLLFGTIDLDNIDNVVRMAWGLGIDGWCGLGMELASLLATNQEGGLLLEEAPGRDLVRRWGHLRQTVYETLLHDPTAVSAQAVLSEAIGRLIDVDAFSANDWSLTDEALMERLRNHPHTKNPIVNEYFDRLPQPVCCIQLRGRLQDYGFDNRKGVKEALETSVKEEFPEHRVLAYALIDRGTFQKALGFINRSDGRLWTEGTTSESVILYTFLRGVRSVPRQRACRAADRLVRRLGVSGDRLMRVKFWCDGDADDGQGKLNFAVA